MQITSLLVESEVGGPYVHARQRQGWLDFNRMLDRDADGLLNETIIASRPAGFGWDGDR